MAMHIIMTLTRRTIRRDIEALHRRLS